MRHLVDHRKLGRTTSHRKALLRNLVTSLILKGRIETTLPKAKELRSLADRMITWGKQGDLAARRQAARIVQSPEALARLFDGLAKRFEGRAGGYTRVLHFGRRAGDGAPMAAIEYLGYELPKIDKKEKVKDKGKQPEKKTKPKEEAPKKKEAPKRQGPEKKWWNLFGRKKYKKEGS